MKWARILVANDGRNIPKEVSISRNVVPEKIEHMEKMEKYLVHAFTQQSEGGKGCGKVSSKACGEVQSISLGMLHQRNKWMQL